MKRNFTMWVLFDHPEDFPYHYVAKRYNLTKPAENFVTDVNLDSLRIRLEREGYVRLSRTDNSDPRKVEPSIIECWI